MNSPNFQKIVNMIYERSPLQKKKIENYLNGKTDLFFAEAEEFSTQYLGYLDKQGIPLEYGVNAYVKMCNDMMKCQVHFMKTGKYPLEFSCDAFEKVYNSETEMKSYMIGLAISQFLWSTHYEMYSFLKEALISHSPQISSYLEIGPGHGLFLKNAKKYLKKDTAFTAVDISPVSINITKSIINYFYGENGNAIQFLNKDMLELDLNSKFDFITMGEVIEHVNFPEKLLQKQRDLLTKNGKGFVSTCVNCPAIDHVYHFKKIEEIHALLNNCGLKIESEKILSVENLPMEQIIQEKITINYCAIVARQ